MKKSKTYKFRFEGAPVGPVEELAVPERVTFGLLPSYGELLLPRVEVGQKVKTGTVLAGSELQPNVVMLSSVTGDVAEVQPTKGKRRRLRPGHITVERKGDDDFEKIEDATKNLEEISSAVGRSMLIGAGMWPLVGEYPRRGKFADPETDPSAVVVKGVKAEPFKPRGHILLGSHVEGFVRGLEHLQRVVGGLAKIHLVITDAESKLAQEIKEKTRGKAWLQLHYLPVVYPVENDGFLHGELFSKEGSDFRAWYVDVETVAQMGRCLGEGIAPYDRVIALGGNGYKSPIHVRARLGMTVDEIVGDRLVESETRLVRGGLLTGKAMEDGSLTIDIGDQSICAVTEGREREMLGFVRPGGTVDSYSKTFLSMFFPGVVKDCSTNLRGEARRCVCCGYCEEICPAGIMPHQLYKYATEDLLDEVESTGIDLCIECGLCSYVCPSKIEILTQLQDVKEKLEAEKVEAAK